MKRTMNTPGFTAEATLYNGEGGYQATPGAVVYGGTVRAATLLPRPGLFCLKFHEDCGGDPSNPENCIWHTSVGRVNPRTGACE
jgi:hypothetical protein